MQSFQGMMTPKPKAIKVAKVVVDLTQYDDEINEAKLLLVNAAKTKKEDGDKVVDALLSLEQLMRKKNKLDEGEKNILVNEDVLEETLSDFFSRDFKFFSPMLKRFSKRN